MVVMISGLFGGPFVGIPVGLISGAVRYSAGGVSALPCALSTVISGIVGSLVFIWNDKKFPKPLAAATLMFLFVGFEMLLVVMLSPPDISFPYVQNIYPLMLFSSVVGIILFTMVVRSENEKMNTDDGEESVVDEIEEGLKGSDEVKELKDEIAWLKKEVKKLKRSDDE
jgi:LytS/YehU family sensor histidine kinase